VHVRSIKWPDPLADKRVLFAVSYYGVLELEISEYAIDSVLDIRSRLVSDMENLIHLPHYSDLFQQCKQHVYIFLMLCSIKKKGK
jgi:hypothetical protein